MVKVTSLLCRMNYHDAFCGVDSRPSKIEPELQGKGFLCLELPSETLLRFNISQTNSFKAHHS